jgi:putative hemolysin
VCHPVNSDTITPTTISVRPQSYIGANNVQPQIVNNTVVYCSARGGHVRELGYSWQSSGFVTMTCRSRASHLFDEFDIVDMAYAKRAPQPLLRFVSSKRGSCSD